VSQDAGNATGRNRLDISGAEAHGGDSFAALVGQRGMISSIDLKFVKAYIL
jgi:hypothetical protein